MPRAVCYHLHEVIMNYLSARCRSVTPYVAGEQPRGSVFVKLNTNECPYPPSPAVEKVLKDFDAGVLRLYPDPDNIALKDAVAKKYGLKRENVFVGNGSDEVLALCFPTFFDEGDAVAFADVTYTFYKVWAHAFGLVSHVVPVNDELKISAEDYLSLPSKVKGIVICNPNAPTGMPMPRADLINIISSNPDKIVIADEAYCDFAQESMIGYLNDFPNLVIVKTLSKAYALAGARCGFALASPELIAGLNTVKNSFNSYTVNAVTEKLAVAALEDAPYYAAVADKIVRQRETTSDALRELGFEVLPSRTNFIFASHKKIPASEIYFSLKENGVLVRHFKADRINNFVRITIGTPEQMNVLLDKVKKLLKGKL